MLSRSSTNLGHVELKTRSLCQISLKPYSTSRGHTFALIFKELYQNICLDDILVKRNVGHVDKKLGHSFNFL